jgi:hypothetical protein
MYNMKITEYNSIKFNSVQFSPFTEVLDNSRRANYRQALTLKAK